MKKHRPRREYPYRLDVQIIRGRLGQAPVQNMRDPIMRDCTPIGWYWPDYGQRGCRRER